jgi:uncharacterized protein
MMARAGKIESSQPNLVKMLSDLFQRFKSPEGKWSALRLARMTARILANFPAQIEIYRLLSLQEFAGYASRNPRMPFKFAADDYLLRGLNTKQRKTCFLHHYRRLKRTFPASFLHRLLHDKISLVELRQDDSVYRVTAYLSAPFDKEGELTLNLEVDQAEVFLASFTVIPGSIVGSEFAEAILISRLQGTRGKFDEIRRATRALHDVAPAFVLVAAMEGLAEALGIVEVIGTSASRQASYTGESPEEYSCAYDSFFNELGAAANPSGLFSVRVPIVAKPMSEVKRGHKLRTRQKRAFKREIADAVRQFILSNCRSNNGVVVGKETPQP